MVDYAILCVLPEILRYLDSSLSILFLILMVMGEAVLVHGKDGKDDDSDGDGDACVCVSLYLCVYVGMCLYAGKSQDKEVVRMAEKGARKKFPPCSRNCFRLFRPFDILFTPQDTLIKCLLCKSRHHAEPWGSPERTQSNRRGDRDICGQGPDRGKRGVPGSGGAI